MKLRVLAVMAISALTITAHALPLWNTTFGYGASEYDAYWDSVREARNDCAPDVLSQWKVSSITPLGSGYQAEINFNCRLIGK